MLSNISISDFFKINDKINVIDIRSIEKYNGSHIDNAINIPYEKLILDPSLYLKKNEVYFIYCQKGSTSLKMCSYLIKQGYRVINIVGGYEAWLLYK